MKSDKIVKPLKSFKFDQINHLHIVKYIDKLKISNSIDNLGMASSLIKASTDIISNCLAYIFNKFLVISRFPSKFKIAKVVPVHKSGSTNDPSNYRPISVLPNLSKLFEYLLHDQISFFLEDNMILNDCQFGFRRYHNTTHATLNFVNNILQSFNSNNNFLALFIDFRKAFDMINHNILLQKLEHYYNFENSSILLLNDYLNDRSFFVSINDSISTSFPINHGVPQGSVLGPTLFSLFLNDFFSNLVLLSANCFADDTVIGKNISKLNDVPDVLDELKSLFLWFDNNHLVLNIKKCEFVNFYKKKNILKNIENLHVGVHSFNISKSYKYLGLFIDCQLKFEKHYKKLFSLTSYYISLFRFLSNITLKKHRSKIYLAFLLPVIEYCNAVFMHFSKSKFDKLEKLNKKLLHFTDLSASQFSLNERLNHHVFNFIENKLNKKCPYVFNYLDNKNILQTTRYKVRLPAVHKEIYKHSLDYFYPAYIIYLEKNNNHKNLNFFDIINSCF